MDFDEDTNTVQCKFFDSLKRIPSLVSQVHSCISSDLSKYVFFVDDVNIYKYDMKKGNCETFLNHQIQGLYLLDDRYCYTLSHSNNAAGRTRSSGLRLYDLENMINKNSDNSYHLTDIQVGVNNKMDFSRSNNRLIF